MTLDGSPYQGYLYAYPHKTAYRPLRPRPALGEVWGAEPTDALFLYAHLPFCEMRCGFCNLFTRANPPAEQVSAYLAQLRVQTRRVADALGPVTVAQAAVGGGTPTYLTASELTELFDLLDAFGRGAVPTAVETSPATATPDRLAVLAERGTTRVSIGVQSFLDAEAHAAGRPQKRAEVDRALDAIRASGIPELNVDLIYGIDGQTERSWEYSLATALEWAPEEVFLYPLYVRPLTGLGRRSPDGSDPAWDAQRLALYRQGRDRLRAAGYRQLSLRHFRRPADDDPTDYHCQDDGMVGLGCGARSYTTDLHYSFDYAVGIGQVRAIIDDYLARPASDFDHAEVGYHLDDAEQRRRWLVKSLLRSEGLVPADYGARFGTSVDTDFPQLSQLAERGWLTRDATLVALTDDGLERADAIGPWLVSSAVRAAMEEHVMR
ncbi:STM4012 family radical SAM protein [Cryptosporangium sp. NPDC048952]|uniref:STM4012 family radical SAM protein n=1 Tax=Cryptosporangium sp. NPDC048952 TaxID=3363961 RepID=UPI003717BA96